MGGILSSIAGLGLDKIGSLAKDIRTAITGKEPIDATKASELALKAQELESQLTMATMSIALSEAQSTDKVTSRSRPYFLYTMYIMLLSAIPMGIVYAIRPDVAMNIASGFKAWLEAIPSELYTLFGFGYGIYGTARSIDKWKGSK